MIDLCILGLPWTAIAKRTGRSIGKVAHKLRGAAQILGVTLTGDPETDRAAWLPHASNELRRAVARAAAAQEGRGA